MTMHCIRVPAKTAIALCRKSYVSTPGIGEERKILYGGYIAWLRGIGELFELSCSVLPHEGGLVYDHTRDVWFDPDTVE